MNIKKILKEYINIILEDAEMLEMYKVSQDIDMMTEIYIGLVEKTTEKIYEFMDLYREDNDQNIALIGKVDFHDIITENDLKAKIMYKTVTKGEHGPEVNPNTSPKTDFIKIELEDFKTEIEASKVRSYIFKNVGLTLSFSNYKHKGEVSRQRRGVHDFSSFEENKLYDIKLFEEGIPGHTHNTLCDILFKLKINKALFEKDVFTKTSSDLNDTLRSAIEGNEDFFDHL